MKDPGIAKSHVTKTLILFLRFLMAGVDSQWPNHRRPKLTMRVVVILNLYANVQRVKRDMFATDIYCYITTEF